MRAGLVAAVLGAGTALVFGLAALTATLFPNGTVVTQAWNGGGVWIADGRGPVIQPLPLVEPAPDLPLMLDRDGEVVGGDEFVPLPGDTVGGGWAGDPTEP